MYVAVFLHTVLWNTLNESDADVELIQTCLHFSSKTTAFLRTVRARYDNLFNMFLLLVDAPP